MKKLLAICAIAMYCLTTFSQTNKETLLIDAQSNLALSFSTQKENYNRAISEADKNTTLILSPSVGYFISDNFVMGLSIPLKFYHSKKGSDTYDQTSFGIAPFTRFYFGTSNIKPFLHAEVGYVTSSYKATASYGSYDGSSSGILFGFGGGIAFFIKENIALNAILSYNGASLTDGDNSDYKVTTGEFGIGLGFSLHL
jgi:hypothetical protein